MFDNLVTAGEIAITQETKPPWIFAADTPTTIPQWIEALRDVLDAPNLGVKKEEVAFFASRLACYMSSCDERRKEQYENESWYEFIRADLSPAYERVLARGLTLMLVAMKAKVASVNTIGKILVQLLIDILDDDRSPDRVLNQPTNDAWIKPWIRHLRDDKKVTLVTNARARELDLRPRRRDLGGGHDHGVRHDRDRRPLRPRGAGRGGAQGDDRRTAREGGHLRHQAAAGRVDERHPLLPRQGRDARRTATRSTATRRGR